MTASLEHAARIALEDCLGLKPFETVLILTDPTCQPIGAALFKAARAKNAYAVYTEIPVQERNGQELPRSIIDLMKGFQVVVAPMEKSITHTDARREACRAGARVATMPGILEETMLRCLSADYYAIAARTEQVTQMLSRGEAVGIRTEAGTDLRFSIRGINGIASTGLIHQPGGFGNLPSGEAYLRPLEGTANGRLVIDGSMAGIGNLMSRNEIIRIEIADGLAVKIDGGSSASKLDEMLRAVGPQAFTVAEFGVGTNDAARIIGNILEDEKVMGTIHIAFGNNVSMGGSVNVPIHLDGIVRDPTVELDGKLLMENGKLIL